MMNYFKIFARTVATATLSASLLVLSASAQTAQPQAAKPAPSKTAAAKPAPANKLASETGSQKAAPGTEKKSAKATAKKSAPAATEAKTKAKPARHASHKAAAKTATKKETKPVVTAAKPAAAGVPVPAAAIHPAELPELTHGRDPFAALIHESDANAGHSNLPPGIAGLQVSTVQLQGMVKTSGGMVAVVANPQDRVYFLHDGDHIYDGVVEKIGIDEITFLQQSKDAFGRTVDRDVSKRLYPIAGDEQ